MSRVGRTAAGRHALNWGLRALAVVVALLTLAVPAYAYWDATRPPSVEMAEQVETPLPGKATALPGGMPAYDKGVIVLCYHSIAPGDEDPYAVTPHHFAAQMAALKAAGFQTISAAEFAAYANGEEVDLPEKPLMISFDDGIKTNWIYADPILREAGFEATEYLITGDVSRHQPYYLSWPEVEAMQASGRWSFGSHTDLGHGYVVADAQGDEGPFLTNREWLPKLGRLETIDEYRARVSSDLDRSITMLERHGLPRPVTFAYPFSAVESTNDPILGPTVEKIIAQRFPAPVDNRTEGTLIEPGESKPLSRVEVFQGTQTIGLLRELRNTIERDETGREAADAGS
jgi:peptidoglycan/xylan/chitin deacetylase (PgdA/CDA1 family)